MKKKMNKKSWKDAKQETNKMKKNMKNENIFI